jgi:hypothetical protein
MMNELEMKYHLKDLEQRMTKWETKAANQATCRPCVWMQSFWHATRTRFQPSKAGLAITAHRGHDAT